MNMIRRCLIFLLYPLLTLSPQAYADSCATYTPKVFEGYFNVPNEITTDGIGNVWIKNSGDNTIARINVMDSTVTPVKGAFSAPFSIAADKKGNLWIFSIRGKTLTKVPVENPTGPFPSFAIQGKYPRHFAVGSDSHIWVIDGTNSVIELSGSKLDKQKRFSASEYEFVNLSGMAADLNGNLWVGGGEGGGKLTFLPGSMPKIPFVLPPKYLLPKNAGSLTTDAQGNVYVLNFEGNSVTKFAITDSGVVEKTYTGAQYKLDQPSSMAVDPEGNIWIANSASVVEIPFGRDGASIPYDNDKYKYGLTGGIAADIHGNIWILNIEENTVTKLIVSRNAC